MRTALGLRADYGEVPELVQALTKDVECAGKSFQPFYKLPTVFV